MELGLCCLLHNNKEYKFRTYTRARMEKLSFHDARLNVHEVLTHNTVMLGKFFDYCRDNSKRDQTYDIEFENVNVPTKLLCDGQQNIEQLAFQRTINYILH